MVGLPLLAVGLTLVPIVVGVVGLLLALIGLVAAGWAANKSQAATAWRQASDGYKEQVTEVNGRLGLAEQLATSLQSRVDQLEKLPDLRAVVEAVDGRAKELMEAVKNEADQIVAAVQSEGKNTRAAVGDLKGVLDGNSERRG